MGAIVEKLRGKSFQQCVEDEIFKLFAMNNSFFKNDMTIDESFRKKHQVAYYYEKKGKEFTRWTGNEDRNSAVILSAGGITTSAKDLFTFKNALTQYKILNRYYLDTMWTPYVSHEHRFHWAYGWIYTKGDGVGTDFKARGALKLTLALFEFYAKINIY